VRHSIWDLKCQFTFQASQSRAEQLGYLANAITEKWLDSDFRTIVEKAQTEKNLTNEEQSHRRNIGYATNSITMS